MNTGKDLAGGEKSADLSLEVTREIPPTYSSPKGQKVVPQKRFCESWDEVLAGKAARSPERGYVTG